MCFFLVPNVTYEYCWIGKNTTMQFMKWYVRKIEVDFQSTYLKQPTQVDLKK
jgi:hypothetical protein